MCFVATWLRNDFGRTCAELARFHAALDRPWTALGSDFVPVFAFMFWTMRARARVPALRHLGLDATGGHVAAAFAKRCRHNSESWHHTISSHAEGSLCAMACSLALAASFADNSRIRARSRAEQGHPSVRSQVKAADRACPISDLLMSLDASVLDCLSSFFATHRQCEITAS